MRSHIATTYPTASDNAYTILQRLLSRTLLLATLVLARLCATVVLVCFILFCCGWSLCDQTQGYGGRLRLDCDCDCDCDGTFAMSLPIVRVKE